MAQESLSPGFGTGLDLYGRLLRKYTGTGRFRCKDVLYSCQFVAGQLSDGDVVLLCEFGPEGFAAPREDAEFVGETADGTRVKVSGHVHPINWLPEASTSGVRDAFRADELRARFPGPQEVSEIRFGLTNLKFFGSRLHQEGERWVRALPVAMQRLGSEGDALVVPVADYEIVARRLSITKGPEVTAELIVPCSKLGRRGQDELPRWVDDLCYVLSVSRGTKVQWVYREERTNEGDVVARVHANRVTKPYSGMPAIDYRQRLETEHFVATAMAAYASRRDAWELDRVINIYLDARLETDFLEPRGLKMVVTGEALKAAFLAQPEAENLAHRRSFGSILRQLCERLDLTIPEECLDRFVQSRNKLVHVGKFYCEVATSNERKRTPPFATPREEFWFLVNFLDRIFLKMLGYSGTYVDWSQSPPTRAELP